MPAIAIGVRAHPMVSVGASLKWVDVDLGGVTGSTFIGDIGALLRVERAPWTFGVGAMYQNFGGRVDFGNFGSFPTSRNYKVGVSATVPVRLSEDVAVGGHRRRGLQQIRRPRDWTERSRVGGRETGGAHHAEEDAERSWHRRSTAMNDERSREPARDPQDLERLLVRRQRAGDVEGMLALYEREAALDCGDGRLRRGSEAIRGFFAEQVATGKEFEFGDQRPAIVCGDLALTSTRLPDGSVTAEVARRQANGSWLWIIDKHSVE